MLKHIKFISFIEEWESKIKKDQFNTAFPKVLGSLSGSRQLKIFLCRDLMCVVSFLRRDPNARKWYFIF